MIDTSKLKLKNDGSIVAVKAAAAPLTSKAVVIDVENPGASQSYMAMPQAEDKNKIYLAVGAMILLTGIALYILFKRS